MINTSRPNASRFFNGKAVYLGTYFLLSLCAWALANEANACASRWMSDAALFGDFNVSLRTTHFLAHLFVMGQEATLLMFLSKYHGNDPDASSGLIRWIIKSTVVKSFCLLALVMCGLHFHPLIPFNWIQEHIWIGYAAMPFIVISGIYERFFLFMKSFFISFLSRGIYQPVLFVLLLLNLPESTPRTPITALYVYIATFILASVIYSIHGWYSGFTVNKTPNYSEKKAWQYSGLLYTLSTLIIKGTPSMLFFFLERYGPSESSVGFFAAIATLNYGYHLLTKPFDSYLKPSIAKLYHDKKIDELQTLIKQVNKVRWGIITALTLVLLLAGKLLLGRYGQAFEAYYPGLAITAILSCVQYYGQTAHELLNYTGNQGKLSTIMVIQLLAISYLAITLIPAYGIYGAIFAQGIPCLLCVFASAYQLKKSTGLKLYFLF